MTPTSEEGESQTPTEERDREILAQASALGIPWERILTEEIRAERKLREYIPAPEECALHSAYWILPHSLLHSFRVRDLIANLSWEASASACRNSVRQLQLLRDHLSGKSKRPLENGGPMAMHLGFGYHRVIALQRICREARKSRGEYEARIAKVIEETGCRRDDAEWAMHRETTTGNGHALDDAMRRTREEGFELPTAESEVRAFRKLQRFVKASGASNGGRR